LGNAHRRRSAEKSCAFLLPSVIPDARQREALLRWSGISRGPFTDPGSAARHFMPRSIRDDDHHKAAAKGWDKSDRKGQVIDSYEEFFRLSGEHVRRFSLI